MTVQRPKVCKSLLDLAQVLVRVYKRVLQDRIPGIWDERIG